MSETNALKVVSARHVSDRHTFASLTTKGPASFLCTLQCRGKRSLGRLDQREQYPRQSSRKKRAERFSRAKHLMGQQRNFLKNETGVRAATAAYADFSNAIETSAADAALLFTIRSRLTATGRKPAALVAKPKSIDVGMMGSPAFSPTRAASGACRPRSNRTCC